eukprot:TRINITY_DN1666_c0_g1_i1.p2 TRINITY_DN1666_c0_g1~~TRINITY_DN1666_c0_g1_i1.p2  ORF type:complete len:104 (-),score=11.33 TRINITY_DN1666_c0_g1_i1:40-351(-)
MVVMVLEHTESVVAVVVIVGDRRGERGRSRAGRDSIRRLLVCVHFRIINIWGFCIGDPRISEQRKQGLHNFSDQGAEFWIGLKTFGNDITKLGQCFGGVGAFN